MESEFEFEFGFEQSTAKAGFDLGMQQDAGSLQQALEHLQTQGIHPDVIRSDFDW